MSDNVKNESKAEAKAETKASDNFSVFVDSEELIDISIKCYKKDGTLIVEGDDKFDSSKTDSKEFHFWFRRPCQGDVALIHDMLKAYKNNIDLNSNDFGSEYFYVFAMEYCRFCVLIRKWDLGVPTTKANLDRLDPKMVKAVNAKLRDIIAMDGII